VTALNLSTEERAALPADMLFYEVTEFHTWLGTEEEIAAYIATNFDADPASVRRVKIGMDYSVFGYYPMIYKSGDAPVMGGDKAEKRTIKLTRAEFRDLKNYSHSMPTGTTIGKRWKRQLASPEETDLEPLLAGQSPVERWLMGEYYDIGSDTRTGIRWSHIEVIDP
jgi:hypothetical protein